MPLYFAEEELPLFMSFLERDVIERGPYSVIFNNGEIVGCGGIALKAADDYTKEQHVIMAWGLVDNKYHKSGFGKELLKFRVQQAKEIYPGITIALGTTQHTFQFFEKYGFKTVAFEKDHWAKGLDLYQMEFI